jgi:hypothetical protein
MLLALDQNAKIFPLACPSASLSIFRARWRKDMERSIKALSPMIYLLRVAARSSAGLVPYLLLAVHGATFGNGSK